jgi:hypothetical protein
MPLHSHDCSGCRFLGSLDGKDFYQCDHIDLCVRWGDADEENKSLPISVVRGNTLFYGSDWDKALALYDQSVVARRQPRA